jgi:uncharacterized repeat protein (TIGR03847 family)
VLIELDPVDRITADAVGPAGQRVFYIQARQGTRLITLLVEKQQVQLLAASVVEILSRVGKETGQGPPEETMGLEEPLVAEWRAGRLSIGYQEERDLIVLEAEEVVPEEEGEVDGGEEDPEAQGTTTLEAVEAMERQFETETAELEDLRDLEGLEDLCARGRPRCQLCGNPIDPEGHRCPALNGQGGSSDS